MTSGNTNNTSAGGSRGWFEGTLDVITGNNKGMTGTSSSSSGSGGGAGGATGAGGGGATTHRRSSTPPIHRSTTPTATTTTTPSSSMLLQRLPSQDSLDRSIHNDSSHGGISKEQQIQALKQANAKLTAHTAQLEADFMNQLQQEQMSWQKQQEQWQNQIHLTTKQVTNLETRCAAQERRMADKDAIILRLREEAGYHRQSLSELQLQLMQQQQAAAAAAATATATSPGRRSIGSFTASSSSAVSAASSEEGGGSNHSATAAAAAAGTSWRQLERTQAKLKKAEQALAQQQAEFKVQQQQYEKRLTRLQQELAATDTVQHKQQQPSNNNNNNQKSHDDDDQVIIVELRQKVLEYSSQLTALTEELAQTKQSSETAEQYRREEANDLRILHDAQEQTLDEQRKRLEEAIQEVELREQELQQVHEQWQQAVQANHALQLELEQTKDDTAKCVADLQIRMDEFVKVVLGKQQRQQQTNGSGRSSTAGGQSTKDDLARVADLQAKLQMLRSISQRTTDTTTSTSTTTTTNTAAAAAAANKHQSVGALEEDLRKELQSVRSQRDRLRSEMKSLQHEHQEELDELRGKLADRDTTISALVKSSVAFEEQIESERAQNALLRAQQMIDGTASEGVDVILSPANSLLGEELAELRETITEYREKEETTLRKMARLDKELRLAKHETAELRARLGLSETGGTEEKKVNDDDSITESTATTSFTYTPGQQIKDRDDAIANILKQLMAKEREVKELQAQVESAKEEKQRELANSKVIAPSWDEVNQLREEAEVFASQIIELDEEIDGLKATVELRETRIRQMEQELKDAKESAKSNPADSKKIMNLEAEIDELQEANTTLQDEIRLLRRKAREFETYHDDIAQVQQELRQAKKQVEDLKKNAETAEGEIERLTQTLEENRKAHANELSRETARLEDIIREKEDALEALEAKQKAEVEGPDDEASRGESADVAALQAEIDSLRTNLTTQNNAVESAKSTIRELENILAERRSKEAADYEHEKEELLSEIDSLTTQLEEARAELKKVENERGLIDDFKQKLESADEAREASEKLIVDTYERKLKLLTLDKDATIDKLRRELVAEKENSDMQLEEAAAQVQMLENQIEEMKEETTAELTQRETKIFALETTLQAQEQLVNNMRVEMDHLQGSMETAAKDRKKEIEDLQQECTDLTTANGKQEREIKALQSELEEKELKHKSEVEELQKRISVLEEQTNDESEHRNAADLKMELRVQEVRDRLEKLKWANTALKEDNEQLRERLEKAEKQARIKLAGQDELNELKFGLRKRDDRIKELELELETLKLSPIIVGPSHPVTPTTTERKTAKSTPRTQASPRRQRSIGGLLGRRRTQSQDGIAELPPKP